MNIDTFHKMLESATLIVERGSVVYQTLTMYSDRDILVVVPDEYKPITESGKNGIVEYITPSPSVDVTNNDYQFVCESDFQRMIDDCTVLAIESMCYTQTQQNISLKLRFTNGTIVRCSISISGRCVSSSQQLLPILGPRLTKK